MQPADSILEVGCGTGVASRSLVRRTGRTNHLTAVDLSPYLLGEAAALARREGIADFIEFRKRKAEALDFPDSSFDVTFSVTVMEEVNAARMFDELVRVTKPGEGLPSLCGPGIGLSTLTSHCGLNFKQKLKRRVAPGLVLLRADALMPAFTSCLAKPD